MPQVSLTLAALLYFLLFLSFIMGSNQKRNILRFTEEVIMMKKRLLAMLLVLSMVVTLLPATAPAA